MTKADPFPEGLAQRFKLAYEIDVSSLSKADLLEVSETDVYHVVVKTEESSKDDSSRV